MKKSSASSFVAVFLASLPLSAQTPAQPPAAQPPAAQPPAAQPPAAQPPAAQPPAATNPPATESTAPPADQAPASGEVPAQPVELEAEVEGEPEAASEPESEPAPVVAQPPAEVVSEVPPPPPPPMAILVPAPAEEPSVSPLIVTGSFFSRLEVREGYEEHARLTHPRTHREGDMFVYRARLGLATQPLPLGGGKSVSVQFSPQASGVHSTGPEPVTIGDAYDLGVHEAYVRLARRDFTLDVGRFSMNYGEGLVIGNLDWNEAGRAFQGGRIRFSGRSGYYTDVFATLISEGAPETRAMFEGDRYFYGIYTGFGPLVGKQVDFDIYVLSQTFASRTGVETATGTADQEGASFFTLGARLKQRIQQFDYHVEAGLQAGTQPVVGGEALDKLAYQADAGVGLTPIPSLRVGVGGLIASGDSDATDGRSQEWNELFPTTHKFLGLSDVFGQRTNAISGNLDVHYAPLDELILKLQGHVLAQPQSTGDGGENYVGTEIDAQVIHPIGKGLAVRGLYALFLPNESYWNSDAPVHYVEAHFGWDF